MKQFSFGTFGTQALGAALLLAALAACQRGATPPDAAQIEATAMKASQQGDRLAEQRLRDWAAQGATVARRELGLLYSTQPQLRREAMHALELAARSGDAQAAFGLAEMYRAGAAGAAGANPAPAAARPWYLQAALRQHARAALMLGLLYKNGEGVPRDAAQAAGWLAHASKLGNAHAMFLLSNAYMEGSGVARDAVRGRALLEQAAEHEYPPAIQELAMAVQHGDAYSEQDGLRASHLLKEATEHRHNNWNRF